MFSALFFDRWSVEISKSTLPARARLELVQPKTITIAAGRVTKAHHQKLSMLHLLTQEQKCVLLRRMAAATIDISPASGSGTWSLESFEFQKPGRQLEEGLALTFFLQKSLFFTNFVKKPSKNTERYGGKLSKVNGCNSERVDL